MSNYNKLLSIIAMLLLVSVMLSSCLATDNDQYTVISPQFDEKVQEIVSDGELPSLQIAVIYQNQLAWSKSYGQNASVNLAYMNGSVQKVIDATAVLQLYERKLIDLDASISDYIPFQVKHPRYPDTLVTVRMLLSHRSGLDSLDHQFTWDTENLFVEYRPSEKPEIDQLSLEEFLVASFTPEGSNYNPDVWLGKPGDKYHYSVSAYPLLRYMIEKVSGISYSDYMNENIFKPLGISNTGLSSDDLSGQNITPYTRVKGNNIELSVWNGNGYLMRTTAEDMAKFMLAHINNGNYDNFQLLQPETIELMREKASEGRNIFNPNSELTDSGYGLGLIHYPHGWLGHGGSTVGYQSLWQFNPSKQCGFIIFTNINGILGSYDDFQSVWKNIAEIRKMLFSILDPLANFQFPRWGPMVIGALTLLVVFVIRRLRRSSQSPTK
ncbi:serine hydrolase domain-containing protein [Chloroflexota bacterium]